MRAVILTLVAMLAAGAAHADTFAIVGATVHTLTADTPIEDATVVVRDGKIVAVGKGVAIPADARRIEAKGRVVTPGLMSANTEIGLMEIGSADASVDHGVEAGKLGAAFDVQYALNDESSLLPQARAEGLTRAVAAPTGSAVPPFLGIGAVVRLSDGGDILDRPGAALFVQMGGRGSAKTGGSRAAPWVLLRAMLDEAKAFKAGKTDTDPREPLLGRADVRAIQPVLDGRMPLAIGASRESDIRQALELARDYGLKVILYGGEEGWRLAPRLAAARIPVVLDPGVDEMETFDTIGARPDNAALLAKAGVRIAFGPSPTSRGTYDGGAMLREYTGYMIAAGLPWQAALRAVTVDAARIFGIDGHYGRIAPGQDADLVIWDGDPFQVTTTPVAVFVRGEDVGRVTRQQLLRDRYTPSKVSGEFR